MPAHVQNYCLSPLSRCSIQRIGTIVLPTTQLVDIGCREVWKELVNYMEGDLSPEMRHRISRHLQACRHCTAIYDGSQNVVKLLADNTVIELPQGFSDRLYNRVIKQ
jgi:anti-sigma factor RsiW